MFNSIIESVSTTTPEEYLICSVCSLVIGIVIALFHMFKNEYSKNIIITLVVLPVIVQNVIMLVNGSIGAGLAVMGAFSLVRFRSAQGNSREIASIFLAMTTGIATAMGMIGVAAIMTVLVGGVMLILSVLKFGDKKITTRELKILLPEDLDFEGIFDDVFEAYTTKCEQVRCKTTNMGSLYELKYEIVFKKGISEKAFIDTIRCRNGNLDVSIGRASTPSDSL